MDVSSDESPLHISTVEYVTTRLSETSGCHHPLRRRDIEEGRRRQLQLSEACQHAIVEEQVEMVREGSYFDVYWSVHRRDK
jgi:hypothetical protein